MRRATALTGNFTFSLAGKPHLLSASGQVKELLGFTADDFHSGRVNLLDRIHPHDADIRASLLGKPGTLSGSCCLRFRRAEGRIRCMKVSFHREQDIEAALLHLLVQDAREVSRPLDQESHSPVLRSLLESSADFFNFKDRNHVYTAASRNLQAVLEPVLRDADLVGLTDYDFLPENEANGFYRLEKEVLDGSNGTRDIQGIVRPDGVKGWVESRHSPLKNEYGEIVGVFTQSRDITERMQVEEELQQSRDQLRLFIKHAPAALAMFDREMRYVAVSQRWLRDYSLTNSDILGRSHYDVFPDLPERWKEEHRRGLAGEAAAEDEDSFERADGTKIWLRWEILPWRAGDGTVGGIVILTEDITRFKQSEQRLQLAASVFHHASEGICVTDLEGRILEVNETFCRITGYTREEAVGQNPRILKSGFQTDRFYEEMWRTIAESGRWRGEFWNRAKDGRLFAVMSTITTVSDANGKPQYYVALFVDISSIKEQEQKLAQIAQYDALTGLPNREYFTEHLRHAMAVFGQRGQKLVVAYFDLDAFKQVNEAYGRQAADSLLVALGARMKQVLQEGDTLARVGGDEFVAVLLDRSGADSAATVLSRMLDAAAQPFRVGDRDLKVTATAGATFYPQPDDVDADQLMRQANAAMYEAKLYGTNQFRIYDPRRDRSVRGRHEEIDRIHRALLNHELVLHYQPLVNMASGQVIGAEALIRWQHPQRGLLPPGLFLPIIEDHDLIIEVGDWVMETAYAQSKAWAAEGLRIPVSVNVSARQLDQRDFVDRLQSLLARYPDPDPSLLEIEVLETSALQEVARVSEVLTACRRLGISVAIDDFGTGYSSLTYLKRLPFTVLKIDQGFVRDMLDDPDSLAILQGIVGLAFAFRRTPVAEGVESVEHGVLLLKLGCLHGQGYGIARPAPAQDLRRWLDHWKPDPRWTAVRPISQQNWSVLVAETELHAWNLAFEEFVTGRRAAPPELDEACCRFGMWLDAERYGTRATLQAFQDLRGLHHRSHLRAQQAVAAKAQGLADKAVVLMRETLAFRAQVLEKLKEAGEWQ